MCSRTYIHLLAQTSPVTRAHLERSAPSGRRGCLRPRASPRRGRPSRTVRAPAMRGGRRRGHRQLAQTLGFRIARLCSRGLTVLCLLPGGTGNAVCRRPKERRRGSQQVLGHSPGYVPPESVQRARVLNRVLGRCLPAFPAAFRQLKSFLPDGQIACRVPPTCAHDRIRLGHQSLGSDWTALP